jgi:hypothetical protein
MDDEKCHDHGHIGDGVDGKAGGRADGDGMPPEARTSPSELAEPVSLRTSQPMAVCCRKVPLAETTCPAK